MASLKRGNGRAIPLGLRDRPPNTHARVVRRVGPEPDGGCGQPSTGRERTPAGVDGRSRRARFLRVLWTVLHRQRLMSEAAAKEVSATAPGV